MPSAFALWWRRHGLTFFLSVLFVVSSFLMVKSSGDPLAASIHGTIWQSWLSQFPNGNQIIFDSTVGINVSLFIYLLVVWLPDRSKRTRLRRNLRLQYDSFKEETLQIILSASWRSDDAATTGDLSDPKQFRDYFKESASLDQTRWDAFLNGLNENYIKRLIVECEILMAEVHFTLSAIDVDNQDAFALLKRLSQSLHRSKNWSPDYDDVKQLSRFLWSVHTGWSFVGGYPEKDVIAQMIEAI